MQRFRKPAAALAVSLTALLALSACSSGAAEPSADGSVSGEVVFAGYGGTSGDAITSAWLDPFSEESGADAILDPSMDNSKLLQMSESGNVTWDVVEVGLDYGLTEANDTLLDIDCDIVSCDDFTGDWAVTAKGVPMFIYATTLAYNTDSVATAPENWADFFDTSKIPGKRAVNAGEGFYGILEAALLSDGVARDALYPLDVDRALTVLDRVKDDLIFITSGQECIDLVSSGEAALGACYNARVTLAKADGQPIDLVWNQQIQSADYVAIPADAPNPDAAMALVAYLTSSEHAGTFSDYMAYGPGNPAATVSADVTSDVPTANEAEGDNAPIVPDAEWWNENRATVLETVSEWVAS